MKKALISGITGQDGSYLAEILLEQGYEVYGIQRRSSYFNTNRIDHLLNEDKITTFYGDVADADNLTAVLLQVKPDEVYNLGAMSNVRASFEIPLYTGDVTGLGVTRMLEAIRVLRAAGIIDPKFYQASSSEMFGISPPPQSESTPMLPVSPYGISKLYGYHMTRAYRFGYKMFASNGILFNHESERRAETSVVKKIIRAAVRIDLGLQKKVVLGNLDSRRDWGYSRDYCEAIWMILQHNKPDDFVVATGENHSVREFAEEVFRQIGKDFYNYAEFDPKYLRPNEVPDLLGNSTKVRETLGWYPKTSFEQMIQILLKFAYDEEVKNQKMGILAGADNAEHNAWR